MTSMATETSSDGTALPSPAKWHSIPDKRRPTHLDLTSSLAKSVSKAFPHGYSPTRPKFTTAVSSDTSRLMTLERLQPRGLTPGTPAKPLGTQDRQLLVETAVFPEQLMFQSATEKRVSPPALRSASDTATRASANRKKRRPAVSTYTSPTDVFAQNLSDAVLDAEDSEEHEAFVYRDTSNHSSLYALSPWSEAFSPPSPAPHDDPKEKQLDSFLHVYSLRRPVLRSTVSELPSSAHAPFTLHHKRRQPWISDEENTPLLPTMSRRRKKRTFFVSRTIVICLLACMATLTLMWLVALLMASPLVDLEIVDLSNVLGTQKELVFELETRARNRNWWSVKLSHASLSVFASSQHVPTIEEIHLSNQGADPAEFLGAVSRLDDPIVFAPARILHPTVSTPSSQIRLTQPGAIDGDVRGNERWSLLIRYPYILTVRGVLKHHVYPYPLFRRMHSTRVCKVIQVDPVAGIVVDLSPSSACISNNT